MVNHTATALVFRCGFSGEIADATSEYAVLNLLWSAMLFDIQMLSSIYQHTNLELRAPLHHLQNNVAANGMTHQDQVGSFRNVSPDKG